MIVKRLGALTMGKMWGAIYGILGLATGAFISFYWLLQRELISSNNWLMMLFGLPIFYAVIGFAIGLIVATLYNWLAKLIGGIEVDLG